MKDPNPDPFGQRYRSADLNSDRYGYQNIKDPGHWKRQNLRSFNGRNGLLVLFIDLTAFAENDMIRIQ